MMLPPGMIVDIVQDALARIRPLATTMESIVRENGSDARLRKHHAAAVDLLADAGLLSVAAGYDVSEHGTFQYAHCYALIRAFATYDMPLTAALFTSPRIGLHAILHFDPHKKAQVVRACLEGKHRLAFCMSGPEAGSDVMSITCAAVKRTGRWTLNGVKKWITGGVYADSFVVLARTDDVSTKASMNSFSLFLVDRTLPGVTVSRLPTQGAALSGTARIVFDNVVLADTALIGTRGQGFAYCMDTLIEERWITGLSSLAMGRNALEESVRWSRKRRVRGKPLYRIESVRMRLIDMKAILDPHEAYARELADRLSFARNHRSMDMVLAADTATFKAKATDIASTCIRHAQMIFGGRAFETRGPGARIVRLHRQIHGMHCAGGTHDVLMNAAARVFLRASL